MSCFWIICVCFICQFGSYTICFLPFRYKRIKIDVSKTTYPRSYLKTKKKIYNTSSFSDSDHIGRDYIDVVGANFNSVCFYSRWLLIYSERNFHQDITIGRCGKTFAARNRKFMRKYERVVHGILRTFHCLR